MVLSKLQRLQPCFSVLKSYMNIEGKGGGQKKLY